MLRVIFLLAFINSTCICFGQSDSILIKHEHISANKINAWYGAVSSNKLNKYEDLLQFMQNKKYNYSGYCDDSLTIMSSGKWEIKNDTLILSDTLRFEGETQRFVLFNKNLYSANKKEEKNRKTTSPYTPIELKSHWIKDYRR